MACVRVQGEAPRPLVEAPQAPDLERCDECRAVHIKQSFPSGFEIQDDAAVAEQQMEHAEEKLVLTITRDRRIFLGDTEIPPADLEAKLSTNARVQKDKELYLHADRSLPYGQVVEIMAVARRAGVESLGMITDPDRELRRP